jgi:hypothetical protein
MKNWLRRWWLETTKWSRLAWAAYDAGLLIPGAPPPPSKRPRMPWWLA